MTSICWDVDTQQDFISASGLLSVPKAENLVPNLKALTDWAHARDIRIVATADDHAPGDAEISDTPDWTATFPPHCMHGTPGQLKIAATMLRNPLTIEPELRDAAELGAALRAHDGDILLHKQGTDVFQWNPNAATVLAALAPDRVIVYGVATDICTKAAVAGIARLRPQARLVIVIDAIRGIDDAASRTLLGEWRAAGHQLASTAEVVR
jgi:nicotinamidase/pyrazinamidase